MSMLSRLGHAGANLLEIRIAAKLSMATPPTIATTVAARSSVYESTQGEAMSQIPRTTLSPLAISAVRYEEYAVHILLLPADVLP